MIELAALKAKLEKINTYPKDMKAVNCEIKGIGFFPGASGLWNVIDEVLSNKPVMILGHDFGAERDFKLSVARGQENIKALTWSNLSKMLKWFDISEEQCFFTNAIMGVRTEGSALGKSPAYNHPDFLNDCRKLLIKQIDIQRPEIIIVLGLHVLEAISELTPVLNPLRKTRSFRTLDIKNLSVFSDIEFQEIPDFKTNIVLITHPTYYHLNAKHRKFQGLVSSEAEKAMIYSVLNPTCKNHLAQDR